MHETLALRFHPAPLRALPVRLPAIGAWLRRRRAEARATAELAALDDPMLRDIGITRYDIGRIARTGRHDDAQGDRYAALRVAVLLLLAAGALAACGTGGTGAHLGAVSACDTMALRDQGGFAHTGPSCPWNGAV